MATSLAGFKPCTDVPAFRRVPGTSIYDPVINRTVQGYGPYVFEAASKKQASSVATTLRTRIRKREITDVLVMVRGNAVYVTKK